MKKKYLVGLALSFLGVVSVSALEAEEVKKPRAEEARDRILNENIENLGLLLRCIRINGNAAQSADVWWVGMNASGDNTTEFRFPYYHIISSENNEHEIITKGGPAFLFYYNSLRPNEFAEALQYVSRVEKTLSSYTFSSGESVVIPKILEEEFTLNRASGILTNRNTQYGISSEYMCSRQSELDKEKIITKFYRNIENYALEKYERIQANFDKEIANQKF